MIKSFTTFIPSSSFNYKTLRDGQIRIMVKDIGKCRVLISFLRDTNIIFHTYQLKQERAYRVVIKKLYPSASYEAIKSTIENLGHRVRNVTNIKSRIKKNSSPMFFVDLEPSPNDKNIYETKILCNAIVNIVPLKMANDLVQ